LFCPIGQIVHGRVAVANKQDFFNGWFLGLG
jgi:hypothetical protein